MSYRKPSSGSLASRYRGESIQRAQRTSSTSNTRSASSLRSIGSAGSRGTITLHPGMIGGLLLLILALVLGLGALSVVRSIRDRPDVYTSYLTKECVKVVNADGTPGDCAKLPERYRNHWVE